MNKKGFTLVELIAVVVIMAIIAMIATPNIISMMNNGKREDFINNANEIMSKAVYMYKLDKYKNDSNIFENGNRIKLKNIEDINTLEDPFGGEYDLENSYVIIESVNNGTIVERNPSIYVRACDEDNKCYSIGTASNPVSRSSITTSSITEN